MYTSLEWLIIRYIFLNMYLQCVDHLYLAMQVVVD